MTTVALGIPHLPDGGARDAVMAKLRRTLGTILPEHYREFTDKEPNRVWARKMWKWGLDSGAEFFLTLQNDSEVMPEGFWPALHAMLETLPRGGILGLASVHPGAREAIKLGHRWYRTRAWAIGWGYGLWREDLEALLEHEASSKDGATDNEDQFVNRFVGETDRSVWHPVPSIVDHRTELESNYGNDDHTNRRAVVRWEGYAPGELAAPGFWRLQSPKPPPLLPVSLNATSVYIATRSRGRGHPEYFSAMWRLLRAWGVDAHHGWNIHGVSSRNQDVVIATSRILRDFLSTGCGAAYFVDDDCKPAPQCLMGMLRTGHELVSAPYPRRDDSGVYKVYVPEDVAPLFADREKMLAALDGGDGTIPHLGTGLGCTLIRRAAVERMFRFYENEPEPTELADMAQELDDPIAERHDSIVALRKAYELGRQHGHRLPFVDVEGGKAHANVALPLLMVTPDRRLLSEDLSFFVRAKRAGLEPRLYLGPGSPVSHYGDKCFEGKIEHFGLSRSEEPEKAEEAAQ
ncbi:MAG TPA: hypothetical protein VKU41_07425 [Polyangiaceae bacterium]|nr:hypothetical protein [Polyangiaceae bacterium]